MTFRETLSDATFDRPGIVVVTPCALDITLALAIPFSGPVLG